MKYVIRGCRAEKEIVHF